jgi:hypothetical protein
MKQLTTKDHPQTIAFLAIAHTPANGSCRMLSIILCLAPQVEPDKRAAVLSCDGSLAAASTQPVHKMTVDGT